MSLTIAGLGREAGVGVETVRYYQRRGLLPVPERPESGGRSGGVRRYAAEHVRRLRFIRAAQGAGFTLEQIGELLSLDASHDRGRVLAMARARVADLDRRIAELQAARDALQGMAGECGAGGSGPCPILLTFERGGPAG